MCQRTLALFSFRRGVKVAAVKKGSKEVDHPGRGAIHGPATVIAGEIDGGCCRTVVTAIRREHLGFSGDETRHAHGVLHGFGSAIGKEHLVGTGK